ncbi:hypothetical protein PHYBLDRAFT_176109 [Phycomyces blakesleeanus NRRL 1555(-)]|uniref:Uncharacterized protein n=1 Tax=Phycomyces blakesleeanus (strain ATCC 8743b / DSM 1359 / FGSC 10004 / NBRC 33097 / NRRL 1555) TaxID=763407 RepID=A0A167J8Z6_PHYB8|nr:hypothetical protein PHYBLDRAFT_176109 [Phycomyces blakesleeanus NRRL 1555(-)]OAD65517.1 hypothetical protein PHYBLDRAFT_176109 [Phycomyces blakesleeanus NRRL 1555(-)]|eukprot:XP_018283557.1 hypothetical protein PHYBLDRAFT_176109 [Phycomyces blakesleeanus NRRL 1555(-)]
MPTSNNSLESVMDKHCEMVSHSGSADQTQFSGIAFNPLCNFNQEIVNEMHGEVVLRSVTDVFVNHANMEWTCTLDRNPAVTSLLSLRSFLPTEVNEATTKTIVAQKPKTNLLEKVDLNSVSNAESIGRGKQASMSGLPREKIQADFDAAMVETDESNGLETMEVEEVSASKERKHGNQKCYLETSKDSCHGRVLWGADYQISNPEALGEEVCPDNEEVGEAA